MGGGGGDSTSTSYTTYNPAMPTAGILAESGLGMGALLSQLIPQVPLLAGYNPQQIAGITPSESQAIGLMGSLAQPENVPASPTFNTQAPNVPYFQTATDFGPIGTNPLFTDFMKTQMPQILQTASLSGLGQGGQAEAISDAAMKEAQNIANYNLAQAQQQNQAAQLGFGDQSQNWSALNQLSQQGFQDQLSRWQQEMGGLQQWLAAAGLPREIAGQQGQANYAELQALRNLFGGVVEAPFGAMMQMQMQPTTTTQTSGGGK